MFGGSYVPDWFYIIAGVVLICFMLLVYLWTDSD